MEQSLSAEFPITASEPGAGPYDLSGTTRTILGLANQPQPAFAGFFFAAYDSLYNQPSQLAYYFSPTYAPVVADHFGGSYSRIQITTALGGANVETNVLFNPEFTASYLLTVEPAVLKAHIAENDIYNWAPAVPTHLFQGVDDDVVPYANTTTAKAAMDINGSTTMVTVVNCNAVPSTHDNCIKPFAIDVVTYFTTLATGL
jgi:pimeloyl-ACP methyl ester carboxylesterase